MGQLVWQQSEAYVATGEPENNALALKVQKPAQVAYNLFIVGRFILFLLQLKWHNLSKFNFYYELIEVVLVQLFPIDITAASLIAMRMNDSVIRFLVDYFHWWPSLILSVAQIPILYGGRALMYGEPFTDQIVVACLVNMAWQTLNLWIVHLCMTKAGMIYVEAEILSKGNE